MFEDEISTMQEVLVLVDAKVQNKDWVRDDSAEELFRLEEVCRSITQIANDARRRIYVNCGYTAKAPAKETGKKRKLPPLQLDDNIFQKMRN